MTDLFGNPDPKPASQGKPGAPVNDHDLLLAVLATADDDGYRIVGVRERVYRITGKTGHQEIVEPAPRYEEATVQQLIRAGHLHLGGSHPCRYGRHEGTGRAVLVPKRSRGLVARWRGYGCRPGDSGPNQGPSPPAGSQPVPGAGRRILVTGSRTWSHLGQLRTVLARWYQQHPDAVLVHGDAKGADRLAASMWAQWGGRTEAHPADWTTHGRRAGPLRNRHMVDLGADVCLAFIRGGSAGASHTASLAEAAGIPTIRTEITAEGA